MGLRRVMLILAGVAGGMAHKWTAILQPSRDSILAGTAVVEEISPDSLTAEIQVSGAKAGSEIPWHIHRGPCAGGGVILGLQEAYPALKAGADGKATGRVTLAGALPARGEYSITVHRSGSDMTAVACGALKSTGAPESGPAPARE